MRLKVISSNVNGVESARQYGFFDWLTWQKPDVVCLQELNVGQVPAWLENWAQGGGYDLAVSPRVGTGNGGTAILSRFGFKSIAKAAGVLEQRGQSVCVTVGNLSVCSVYVALDNLAEERRAFQDLFDGMANRHDLALICGDFNIIGTDADADTKYGSSALGCKPDERAWLAGLLTQWTDVLPPGGHFKLYQAWPLQNVPARAL